jgi:hypothetical protein
MVSTPGEPKPKPNGATRRRSEMDEVERYYENGSKVSISVRIETW